MKRIVRDNICVPYALHDMNVFAFEICDNDIIMKTQSGIIETIHLGRQVEIIPGSAKPGWINVRAWKGSSDFDSAQMARLIDSLIQDAENLGIPTVPDDEVERMVNRWGKNPSSKKTGQGALSAAG